MKLYRYVGPKRIADRVRGEPVGFPIRSPRDVLAWIQTTEQELVGGCVIATFVLDATGTLLVADRRSEHVMCAGGQAICSAGEITFAIGREVEITEVTNQSTGYCPEPESWSAVMAALSAAGLKSPAEFGLACVFRRCVECSNLTLVKCSVFESGVCGAELPTKYNCQPTDTEPVAALDTA